MASKKTNKRVKMIKKARKPIKITKKLKIHPKSLKLRHTPKLKKISKTRPKMSLAAKKLSAKASSLKRAANAKSKKLVAQKLEEQIKHNRQLEETKKVGELVENKALLTAIGNNVGLGASNILEVLVEGPKTDENIAEKLNIKVNDVRRMLNAMNSYSIVRYDVNKDSKGWLIFTWRIDSEKLAEYVTNISKESVVAETALPGNCNDFFMCKGCYSKEKTVLPFDSAFESDFTCNSCGKPFALMTREETVALFKTTN